MQTSVQNSMKRLPKTYSSQVSHAACFTIGVVLFATLTLRAGMHEPDFDIEPFAKDERPATVEFLEDAVRRRFVQKIYSVVTLQVALTCCVVIGMMKSKLRLDNLLFPSCIASFGSIFLLLFASESFPLNIILFLTFTISTGISVGNRCVRVQEAHGSNVVLHAFVLTMGAFISLTLFTMYSKTDWVFLGPFLFTGLQILIIDSVYACLYGGRLCSPAWVGVVLFSGYVIFDTNQIVRRYHPRQWMLAALDLYLDIINLFLKILEMLSKKD